MTDEPKALIVGLDIGGANLKAALTNGMAASIPFPMWTHFSQTGACVRQLIEAELLPREPNCAPILDKRLLAAVTMTGELSDCFSTRREGVKYIIEQIKSCELFADIVVYGVEGRWYSTSEAIDAPWSVAASNWAAQGRWIMQSDVVSSSFAASNTCGLIIDVGSTTTDIIPYVNGRIGTNCRTDRDRLQSQQLVYTGLERTSVAAMVRQVDVAGVKCPVMAEHFATAKDVYVCLGLMTEDPSDTVTADGKGRTMKHCANRLARMVGEDSESLSDSIVYSIAQQIYAAQATQVALAIAHNLRQLPVQYRASAQLVVTGHGNPLLMKAFEWLRSESVDGISRDACERMFEKAIWIAEKISPAVSRSAPAFAVAWLAEADKCFDRRL